MTDWIDEAGLIVTIADTEPPLFIEKAYLEAVFNGLVAVGDTLAGDPETLVGVAVESKQRDDEINMYCRKCGRQYILPEHVDDEHRKCPFDHTNLDWIGT